MKKQILEVNYKLSLKDLPDDERQKVRSIAVEDAKWIASFPGLCWKIYGHNPETGEFTGIYLFNDETSLKAYLDGPLMTERKAGTYHGYPIQDLIIKQFALDVLGGLTEITRGPIY